jgi:hypothetical protein
MRCEFWLEEVSFLVHGLSKNGLVVNTLEQEHTIALVLKLPMEIVGYVVYTDTSQYAGMHPCVITKI